jgi:DNA polymerase IV
MATLGIATGADLAAKEIDFLRQHFGSQADYLYRAARGIDLRQVKANRPRKSLGAERTFEKDISSGTALREVLERIIAITWERIVKSDTKGRTVTLKLKFADFSGHTRARSFARAVERQAEFARVAHELLDEVLPLPQPVRLMGLTLSAIEGEEDDALAPVRPAAQLPLL